MRHPLDNWNQLRTGYGFMVPTYYSKHHLGIDKIVPVGTRVLAPSDGRTEKTWGPQGGNTLLFFTGIYVMRFMHLSAFSKIGDVKEGDLIALTGNTGTTSTAPHIHVDISKNKVDINDINNFIDPEKFFNPNVKDMPIITKDNSGNQYVAFEEARIAWSIPDPATLSEVKAHLKITAEPSRMDLTGYFIIHGNTAKNLKNYFNL